MGVRHAIFRQHLQGDDLFQLDMPGPIDGPHAPCAEFIEENILAQSPQVADRPFRLILPGSPILPGSHGRRNFGRWSDSARPLGGHPLDAAQGRLVLGLLGELGFRDRPAQLANQRVGCLVQGCQGILAGFALVHVRGDRLRERLPAVCRG